MPQRKAYKFEPDAGAVQTVVTQSFPSKVSFNIRYEHLTVQQATVLMDFWLTVGCNNIPFEIPDLVIRHPPEMVAAVKRLNNNSSLWEFGEQYSITPVQADVDNECSYYSTQIIFVGFPGYASTPF